MIYTLMNKDAELFEIEMINGNIYKVERVREYNRHLFPVFLMNLKDSEININSVITWWRSRRIPDIVKQTVHKRFG